jgi:hypothetical protein
MASILKVDTITGVSTAGSIAVTGEGNSTITNLQQGLAKAWIKTAANGTSISDSLNVSSLGDTGTGQQTVSFTNAMGNEEYAITSVLADAGSYSIACANQAVGSFRGYYFNIGGSAYFDGVQRHAVHGDLA